MEWTCVIRALILVFLLDFSTIICLMSHNSKGLTKVKRSQAGISNLTVIGKIMTFFHLRNSHSTDYAQKPKKL